MIRPRFVVALAALSACAYYNGLYNANRLADEARRAEAEGRRGDARSLWLQAAVRADSVAARYPDSKYWDDALLMSGRAQSRLGDCGLAMPPLTTVIATSDDRPLVGEARILLAECQFAERQFDAVVETVTPLVGDTASPLASPARALRGRAELMRGNASAAVRDLTPPKDLTSRFDLAAGLLASGQHRLASDHLWIAAAHEYKEERWLRLLDGLGRYDPGGASGFVDHWVADGNLSIDARVRLLVADSHRWTRRGALDIAAARLMEASTLSDDSDLADSVQYELAVLELRRMDDLRDLPAHLAAFRELGGFSPPEGVPAEAFQHILARALRAMDATVSGDLLLFREAEAVRDSLRVHNLAVRLFSRVATHFPNSAIVPKALLAMASLRPEAADSILGVLTRDYADSPYTDLAIGGVGAGFAALEDSLRQVLETLPPSPGVTRRSRGERRL